MPEYEAESEYSTDYTTRNLSRQSKDIDKESLIHPTFPSEGVINPSHLGSRSVSPTKSDGDQEEHMPLQFMPGSISSKMSPMPDRKK